MLLRKGGIHDAGGVFELEHSQFWLLPTWLHQNANLVKPEHRDLLRPPRDPKTIELKWWARVERVWALSQADQSTLEAARHIWSRDYVDIRFGYKPEHPLLCVALRVYESAPPHLLPSDPKYFGCRSWIELEEELPIERPVAALEEAAFSGNLNELKMSFAATESGAMR